MPVGFRKTSVYGLVCFSDLLEMNVKPWSVEGLELRG